MLTTIAAGLIAAVVLAGAVLVCGAAAFAVGWALGALCDWLFF